MRHSWLRKWAPARALALGLALSASAYAADSALPAPKKYQGTAYLSGGTTPEQAKAMRAIADTYSLQLTITNAGLGMPAGAAKVLITDQRGDTVLDVVADGPELFVNVPGGRYTVQVEHGGQMREKTFDLIGRRSGQFFFDFAEVEGAK